LKRKKLRSNLPRIGNLGKSFGITFNLLRAISIPNKSKKSVGTVTGAVNIVAINKKKKVIPIPFI
jgi:hypothetical protein